MVGSRAACRSPGPDHLPVFRRPGGAAALRDVAAVRQGRYDVADARATGSFASLQATFGDRPT